MCAQGFIDPLQRSSPGRFSSSSVFTAANDIRSSDGEVKSQSWRPYRQLLPHGGLSRLSNHGFIESVCRSAIF
ncbi:hypothetical protein DNTS_003316 [Danionella cerebrum]|uniref:Uncharacterized protein n=1 Tax=Danionella cerebrum TaxID=2873325 RepID=A0A553MVQ0_9TELE|nr:hypothetical protein DNTS_003316 [Danionella translucida]